MSVAIPKTARAFEPAPPQLRFVERLPMANYCEHERWLVELPEREHPLVAWAFSELESGYLAKTIETLVPWEGVRHERLANLVGIHMLDNRLLALFEDDRGPSLADAAAQLAGAEREAWVIAQIVGVCDALAAVAERARPTGRTFVYRGLDHTAIHVNPGGHARLRVITSGPILERSRTRTGSGVVYGSFHHMSPEEVKGVPLVPESNVFALAGLLVHAIAQRWPFVVGESPMETLKAILLDEPVPEVMAACSPVIEEVVRTAFAKEPAERFADPAAFAGALRACVPDADEVDAVISDRLVTWWPDAPRLGHDDVPTFGPACRQQWGALIETASPDVRHCSKCDQPVVRIRALSDLIPLAGKSCIHSS